MAAKAIYMIYLSALLYIRIITYIFNSINQKRNYKRI
nr:MAG TPA: hypothetical protein [Bacteriophage sp.]